MSVDIRKVMCYRGNGYSSCAMLHASMFALKIIAVHVDKIRLEFEIGWPANESRRWISKCFTSDLASHAKPQFHHYFCCDSCPVWTHCIDSFPESTAVDFFRTDWLQSIFHVAKWFSVPYFIVFPLRSAINKVAIIPVKDKRTCTGQHGEAHRKTNWLNWRFGWENSDRQRWLHQKCKMETSCRFLECLIEWKLIPPISAANKSYDIQLSTIPRTFVQLFGSPMLMYGSKVYCGISLEGPIGTSESGRILLIFDTLWKRQATMEYYFKSLK